MDSVNLPTDIKNEVKEEKEQTPLAAKTVKPKPRVINGRNKVVKCTELFIQNNIQV